MLNPKSKNASSQRHEPVTLVCCVFEEERYDAEVVEQINSALLLSADNRFVEKIVQQRIVLMDVRIDL